MYCTNFLKAKVFNTIAFLYTTRHMKLARKSRDRAIYAMRNVIAIHDIFTEFKQFSVKMLNLSEKSFFCQKHIDIDELFL
jgi:hypothetical protein